MCVLIYSTTSVEKFLILRIIERDIIVNWFIHYLSTSYSCHILMKIEPSRQILDMYSNTKFNENLSSGNLLDPYGQTDGRKDREKERRKDG